MTQSLLLKLRDVHINRARVKNVACFVASRDNSMALEHVTIHFIWTFCLCHLICKHKMMCKTFGTKQFCQQETT